MPAGPRSPFSGYQCPGLSSEHAFFLACLTFSRMFRKLRKLKKSLRKLRKSLGKHLGSPPKFYQVVGGDLILLAGGLALGGPRTAAALLWNSALILVDHIHFQYNGMMLGLLLLSVAAIERGRVYLGAFLFCTLLCMKHIFLYVAPVYFVYLLRGHCGACCWPPRLLPGNLVKLGSTVLATVLVLTSPFLSLKQLEQIAQRLFPFGRGLTHAYWAPNCWALYNTLDRAPEQNS